MADKQIGIKLDVKSTGLSQIDGALDTISKNLKSMNDSVLKEQKKGWGSESQTKELREQLRYMEQMTRLYERMARTQGVHSDSFGQFRSEISRMQGDLHSVPQYKTGRVGGYIHEKYGEKTAQGFDKLTDVVSKLSSLYAGFNLISSLHSGMQRGDQLAYGFGDIAKRLGVNGSALGYGTSTLRALQGYGYDDQAILQSAQQYQGITGRIDPKAFQGQMQAIESTGRRYGWDLSATTQVFETAYQNGVTGGSGAQMNPQQFATLVANATVQAHMQGRESQMVNQLAQVTQMTMQSMAGAGDQKTISAFLAMGDKTGNQALIGNLPNMINGINQGIMNPGGGYGGQALMMRAIGGGKMGFWQEQYQQSLGAFGTNPNNGKTNIENATDYLMQSFGGGDPYRLYSMLGQMFNLNPAQAKQYIDNYTKGGKFKSGALNGLRSQMGQTPSAIPQNDVDKYRNNMMNGQFGADLSGMQTLPGRSYVENTKGDILGSGVGEGLIYGAMGATTLGTAYRGYNTIRKLFGKRGSIGGTGSGGSTGEASESIWSKLFKGGAEGEGVGIAKSAMRGLGTPLALGMGVYDIATSKNKTQAAAGVGGGLAGAWAGGELGAGIGSFLGPIGTVVGGLIGGGLGYFGGDKLGRSLVGGNSSSVHGDPSGGSGHSSMSSTSGSPATTGQELAPIVASTIIALSPYMSQLKSVLGSSSSAIQPVSLASSGSTNPFDASMFKSMSNGNGLKFVSFDPSSFNGLSPFSPQTNLPSVGAKGVPGTVTRYASQIQSAASRYGIGNQTGLLEAIMSQESGGRGTDVMQMAQGAYGSQAGSVSGSIDGGVHEFADDLKKAQSMGLGMQEAIGAYNMGPGILNYFKQNGGYSLHNMMEFSKQHGGSGTGEGNWHGYGDPWYVQHVMRYTKGSGSDLKGTVNVVLHLPDGSKQTIPAPISANYSGLRDT